MRDSAAIDLGARAPQPCAIRPREAAMRALRIYHRMFFLRVAHADGVQAKLVKSSAIKLDESLKLLAEVSDLLRR